MGKWYVHNNRIPELYRELQVVAASLMEEPRPLDGQEGQGRIDTYLSQDDMILWLKEHNKRDRAKLFFVEVGEQHDRAALYSSLEDLSVLYSNLIAMDNEDGLFDGIIQNIPEFFEVFLEDKNLASDVEQYREGIFSVTASERHSNDWEGTAWIVEREGNRYWLITNAHVADSMSEEITDYRLTSADGWEIDSAEVVGVDHDLDVGVLTFISEEDLPVLPVDTDLPAAGDLIGVLGNQRSNGIVFIGGVVNDPRDYMSDYDFPVIHHDGSSAPGNSGSPVFKGDKVIGIHFAGLEPDKAESICYSIPSSLAMESYTSIRKAGKIVRGRPLETGFTILTTYELSLLGIEAQSGYYINSIVPGSRAGAAGLRPGHILLAYDNNAVHPEDYQEMNFYFSQQKPGSHVTVLVTTIESPEQLKTLDYEVVEKSTPKREKWSTPFGFVATETDPLKLAEICGEGIGWECRDGLNGVTVRYPENTTIRPTGIPNYSVIVEVDGKPVSGVADFKKLVQDRLDSGKPICVKVIGTQDSGQFSGQESVFLLNGLEGRERYELSRLGIEYVAIDDAEKRALKIDSDEPAFYVTKFARLSPSYDPLFPGDIITGFYSGSIFHQVVPLDGWSISLPILGPLLPSERGIVEYLEMAHPGEKSIFRVLRNGRLVGVTRKVSGSSPDGYSVEQDDERYGLYGFDAEELDVASRWRVGYQGAGGILISLTDIYEGEDEEDAEKKVKHPYGFEDGMIVTSVNGNSIYTVKQLRQIISEARENHTPLFIETEGSFLWKYPGYRKLLVAPAHL